MFETIGWSEDAVVLLDRRLLPGREEYLRLRTPEEIGEAIRSMAVRGAPAIGVTAAMGLALGAWQASSLPRDQFLGRFEELCRMFAATRPTAVNLFWAIERMRRRGGQALSSGGGGNPGGLARTGAPPLVGGGLLVKEGGYEAGPPGRAGGGVS